MPDLIFSRAATDRFLNRDDVARMAPAAFTHAAAPSTSTRYKHVTTTQAIGVLADHGFYPVQAAQKAARKGSSAAYAEHMIAFAASTTEALADGGRPEIILYNSHNGESSLKLFAGFYRFICSNGIVAGEGFETRIRHVGTQLEGFSGIVEDTAKRLPEVAETINAWSNVDLSETAQRGLAFRAASLRWGVVPHVIEDEAPRGAYFDADTVTSLLEPQRSADRGSDAWRVFNRVQENLLRGGAAIRSFTERNPDGATRRARPVASVGEHVRVNNSLWDVAGEVIEHAA